MRFHNAILPTVLCVVMLGACVSRAPALRDDGTATIAGRDTAGLSGADAERQVLLEAASLTVDHGYQYFRILDARGYGSAAAGIRPGADVTIKVVENAGGSAGGSALWDANKILTQGPAVGSTVAPAATQSMPVSGPPPPSYQRPAQGQLGQPHCTVYGCEW